MVELIALVTFGYFAQDATGKRAAASREGVAQLRKRPAQLRKKVARLRKRAAQQLREKAAEFRENEDNQYDIQHKLNYYEKIYLHLLRKRERYFRVK